MLPLLPNQKSLLQSRVHRFAYLYRITRKDGVALRFTNHDAGITYAGNLYTPAGGFNTSARQKVEGLKERNFETVGCLTSDAITFDDLRVGKYRSARVEVMLVDWRYPWAEPFELTSYWIVETRWTGEVWQAQLEGITHRLKQSTGRLYGRMCDVKTFADGRCNVAGGEVAWTDSGTVTGVNVARRDVNTTLTQTTNWYKRGYALWQTGLNAGRTMEIARSYGTAGRLVFWLEMPYAISVGDTFTIVAGCDRNLATCRDKFDNVLNFRGFPFIPGTDALLRTPNAKA